jgi:phosphate transport system substrate-binding protein
MHSLSRQLKNTAVAGAVALGMIAGLAQATETLNGAGATFPYPIYAKWAEAYKAKAGTSMNYQSIGSGGGIKQITAKTVDFGASDAPLTVEKLGEIGLMQFPMVMGGVVPVVNLEGVKAGELKLTGAVLADIYLGKITNWDDAALKNLNPGVKLPNGRNYRRGARRRFGHDLHLHPLSVQGQPRVQGKDRQQYLGRLADRRERQG